MQNIFTTVLLSCCVISHLTIRIVGQGVFEVATTSAPVSIPFMWDVNVKEFSKGETGKYFLSPKFYTWNQLRKETWQFQIYPKGTSADTQHHVSLFLVHRGNETVQTDFLLFIKNQKQSSESYSLKISNSYDYDLKGWGSSSFIERKVLLDQTKGFQDSQGNVKIGVLISTHPIPIEMEAAPEVPYVWRARLDDLNLETGKYLLSPKFSTRNGREKRIWQLQIYPNGIDSASKKYMSIFIVHRGDDEVSSTYNLLLVNKNAEKTVKSAGINTFGYDMRGWGSHKFIDRATVLDASEGFIFDNNTINIGVELPTGQVEVLASEGCPTYKAIHEKTEGVKVCEVCPKAVVLPNSPQGATDPMNATLQNLYREVKIKVRGVEFSINHVMSFESIGSLLASLMKLADNSSNLTLEP